MSRNRAPPVSAVVSLTSSMLGATNLWLAGLIPVGLTSATQALATWYYERQYVRQYGALAGPVILAASTVTLSQFSQIINIVKSVSKMVRPAPTVASHDGQQKYEYASVMERPRSVPWSTVVAILSVISLKVPDIPSVTIAGRKTPAISPKQIGKFIIACLFLRWNAVRFWRRVKSPIGAVLTTRLITHTLATGPLSSSQMRQVFTSTPLVQSDTLVDNHTHAESANHRNAGGTTAEFFAQQLGLTPYFLQKSLADVRKDRAGDRSYHWAKDLGVPAEEFNFDPQKHACIQVDVDHFIDMPHLLAHYPGVHIVCTFQPTAAAKAEGEYTFRFLQSGEVEYRVSGGAMYTHHVWNYTGDTIVVDNGGFPNKRVVAYHVDRKFVDEHHVIVLLTPLGQFIMPTVIPTAWVVEGPALERLTPIRGSHVVLDVVKPDRLDRSVAIVGSHLCVTQTKEAIDAVHAVAVIAKVAITAGMVDSNISPPGKDGMPRFRLGPGQAALLAGFLREGVPLFPPTVCPPSACVIPVYYDKNGHDSPLPLAGFGSPLIQPNYVHVRDIASENRCIVGRLEDFKGKGARAIPPSLAKHMAEFLRFLIPDDIAGSGLPISHEEVHERQDRPSQRHILDQAESSGPWYKKVFRAFNKPEPYQKVTDPRNITTVTPEAKLKSSRFMYAFHEGVMKKNKHYAFNKTPREVAEFIAELLKNAPFSTIGDMVRCDGHVEFFERALERAAMFRYFHSSVYSELNETLDEQIGMPGFTPEGREYTSEYTRGSGTLETADFNSLMAQFIGYCGWRHTAVNGVKCGPQAAWERLGIYGGDDSLEANVCPVALKRAAAMMGQDYEIEVYHRGQAGVNFLNRTFGPDVWCGDPNSMANPARLLSKLWIGPAHLYNPLERFAERMSGYYRMDLNSPVIGEIAKVSHELLGAREGGILAPWGGKYAPESNWPNIDSGWMEDVFRKSIPDFDRQRFSAWIAGLRQMKQPAALLYAPLCTPPPPALPEAKVPAVVGEELQLPPKEKEEADEPSAPIESTPESEEDEMVPVEIAVAAAAVPRCVKGLKKRDNKKHETASSQKRAYDPKRPDLWDPPKDPSRLPDWEAHRAKVAKRLGISLK